MDGIHTYKSGVPVGILILYFATGIVLIHDSIVAGRWGILAATVVLMVGMIVVLALPTRGVE